MKKHKDYRGRSLKIDLSAQVGCSSGKRGWKTEGEVQHQLKTAQHVRANDPLAGRTPGRVEQGYYWCEACEHYHLRANNRRQRRSSFDWQHGRQN